MAIVIYSHRWLRRPAFQLKRPRPVLGISIEADHGLSIPSRKARSAGAHSAASVPLAR